MVVGRCAALGAVTVMTVACAQADLTAPGSRSGDVPQTAVASEVAASKGQGPQACAPDSKLINRVAVSTADVPGTWWRLTKDRFDELGVTDYKGVIEGFYGESFATLPDAIQFLIDGVATWDENENGYVCAYDVRGTRAWLGDNVLYLFGIADDKHAIE